MNKTGTIEMVAQELTKLLIPLKDELSSPPRARALLAELGFGLTMPQTDTITTPLKTAAGQTISLADKTRELVKAVADEDVAGIVSKGLEVIGLVKNVIKSFDGIRDGISGLGLPGVTAPMISEIPGKLFNHLFVLYLERLDGLTPLLSFLGILEQTEENTGSIDPIKPPFTRSVFHFDRVSGWISKPKEQLSNLYQWGENSFDGRQLFAKLEDILSRAGIPVIFDVTLPDPVLDLVVIEVRVKTDISPKGLLFTLQNDVGTNFSLSGDDYEMNFTVDFTLPVESSLLIQPNAHVAFKPPTPIPLLGNVLFELTVKEKTDPEPYVLLGSPGASRLEAQEFTLKTGANLKWETNASSGSFFIEGGLKGGKVVIDTTGGDGFLTKLLPAVNIENKFDLAIGFSSASGVYIVGSSALEIRMPLHVSLGPISLEGLTLALKFKDGKFPVEIGADIKGTLGPLTVVVENMGIRASISFPPNNSGNLGPLDVSLGFKPPNGLGLLLDAGAVKGGGYLFYDADKEEYAGALELTIAELFSAKAIGLITTKMPDGSKGFSLLIIITAEFNPPFQLGYGFTLNAVGGLLGLNRTMRLDPLRDAVRTGAVNSILFPQNVIANAPRIISDLKNIFPPYEGKFLVGPMGKLGWGTPTLITLSLGIIIEIPGNIAILGRLKIALPEESIPLVQIQVLFVGTIDFDKKLLTIDASLFESFILTMTLEGDMAVRLKWGNDPDFILTAGGFHPSYTPPPLALPTLRRMAINILNTDIARIRIECYQAVTSNTVQFGSRAELYFGFSAISINGHIQFDALFQFSPFYFITEVSSSVSLDIFNMGVFSIRLRFTLEGPTPWRAKGRGSISFFFFDVSADFDKTWGQSKDTSLPDITILPRFMQAIKKREQWSTVLSTGKNLLVSLRTLEETNESTLVLHPSGSLVVQQKILPLNVNINRIGNQQIGDVKKISISHASSAGEELKLDDVEENFARAQYQDLTDAEKLSKPSFEKMPGGVRISADGTTIKNGKMVRRKVEYEITIIDKESKKPLPKGLLFSPGGLLFTHFLRGNSVSKSALSKHQTDMRTPFVDKMEVTQEGFTVALQSNNRPFNQVSSFASEMMAQSFMEEQIAANPGLKKSIHIIANHELEPV